MKYLKVLCFLIVILCVSLIFTGQKAYASNADNIYNFMRDIGFNHAVATAVLVNIECNIDCGSCDIADILRSGGYYGICKWRGSRLSNLRAFCSRNGLSSSSLYGQLRFLEYELSERGQFDQLKSYPNTKDGAYNAAYYWAVCFEVCGTSNGRNRAMLAMERF